MDLDFWSVDHPVKKVLETRRSQNSKPGARSDEYKVGLAVEGGGLRGVVSAAMLSALEDLGFADAFDDIYACSSGAVNAAYFMNRNTWFPLNIYFDDLTTGEFLNFRRILRRQPLMNLEYVFEEVLTTRKPLDYDRIIIGAQRLHVMVTNVDDQSVIDAHNFKDAADLRDALRASAWLPLATKGTVPFRGFAAIDGGIIRFHPFRAALQDSCTHILSLSTRPIGQRRTSVSLTNRYAAWHLNRMRRGLGDKFAAGVLEYLEKDRPFVATQRKNVVSMPSIMDIAPLPGTPEVIRHETNKGALIAGAASAVELIYALFDGRSVEAVVRFQAVDRPIRGCSDIPGNEERSNAEELTDEFEAPVSEP